MSLGMVAFTRCLENHKIRNVPNFTFRCIGISFCCFSCRWQMYLQIGFFRIINCICSGVLAFLSVGWVRCSPIEGTRRSWPGSGFTQPVLSPFRGQENLVSGYKWEKVLFFILKPGRYVWVRYEPWQVWIYWGGTQNFKYKKSEITKILFSTKEVVRKRFSGLLASAFPSSSSSSATSSSGEPPWNRRLSSKRRH